MDELFRLCQGPWTLLGYRESWSPDSSKWAVITKDTGDLVVKTSSQEVAEYLIELHNQNLAAQAAAESSTN